MGRCLKCARKAFVVALCTWALTGLLGLTFHSHRAALALAMSAALLTFLWLAHILTYAIRQSITKYENATEASRGINHAFQMVARRHVLRGVAFSLAGAAVVTMLPVFAQDKKKAGCCLEDNCTDKQYCDTEKCICKRKITS